MYFISANNTVLSTAYEDKAYAQQVIDEMLKIKAISDYDIKIIEKDIDNSKRGHKNSMKENAVEEAERQYHGLKSLEYKAKKKQNEDDRDISVDIMNAKAIHGSAWKKYICDKDGICPKDEERYRYRFKVSKKPTVREIIRFTGMNIKQIYILQQRTKLYPNPKIMKDSVKNYMKYVDETGDSSSSGYDDIEGGLEEYSLVF